MFSRLSKVLLAAATAVALFVGLSGAQHSTPLPAPQYGARLASPMDPGGFSIVQTSSQEGDTTSATVNLQTTPTLNHLLVATLTYSAGDDPTGTPSGYTFLEKTACATTTTATYWKLAGSSEPTNPTWTFPTPTYESAIIREISGISTTTPFNLYQGQCVTGASSFMTPSLTPTAGGTFPIAEFGFDNGTSSFTTSPASGWTEGFVDFIQHASSEGQYSNAVTPATNPPPVSDSLVLSAAMSGAAELILINPSTYTPPPVNVPYHFPSYGSFNTQTQDMGNVPQANITAYFNYVTDAGQTKIGYGAPLCLSPCKIFHYMNDDVDNQAMDAIGQTLNTVAQEGTECPNASGTPQPQQPFDTYMYDMGNDPNPETWIYHAAGSLSATASDRAFMRKACTGSTSTRTVYYMNKATTNVLTWFNEWIQGGTSPYPMPWPSSSPPGWDIGGSQPEYGWWVDHASGVISDYANVSQANPTPTAPSAFYEVGTDAAYQTVAANFYSQLKHNNGSPMPVLLNGCGTLAGQQFYPADPTSWFGGVSNVWGCEEEIGLQNTQDQGITGTITTSVTGSCSQASPCTQTVNITMGVNTQTLSVGHYYVIDSGTNTETIMVTAVSSGTPTTSFTAQFWKQHTAASYALAGNLNSPWTSNWASMANTAINVTAEGKYMVSHCGEAEETTHIQMRMWCVAFAWTVDAPNNLTVNEEDFTRNPNEAAQFPEGFVVPDVTTAVKSPAQYIWNPNSSPAPTVSGASQTQNGVIQQAPGESGGIHDLIAAANTCFGEAHGHYNNGTGTPKVCVTVREFNKCYFTDWTTILNPTPTQTMIGPCAAIMNPTNQAITIQSAWFHNTFGHIISVTGGSIYAVSGNPIGGTATISFTAVPLNMGSTQILSNQALLIAQ